MQISTGFRHNEILQQETVSDHHEKPQGIQQTWP